MKTCYNCKHMGYIENSRHSTCLHPYAQEILQSSDMIQDLMEFIVQAGKIPQLTRIKTEWVEGSVGKWVHFPINFDPQWLKKCNYHEMIK